MNYIEQLKNKNITFKYMNENNAKNIISSEYSYYKLLEYSDLFDRYINAARKGDFINLDFYQLYILARFDEKLSAIIMLQCLEVEQRLKTILLFEIEKSNFFSIDEYIKIDSDYIKQIYTSEYFPIIENKYNSNDICDLKINEFLDVIQFGTLERIIKYYNILCQENNVKSQLSKVERFIEPIKKLRNMAAHNCSIICQLNKKYDCDYNYNFVASFLGNNGINKKTLHTNITKPIMFYFCSLLHMCYSLNLNNENNLQQIYELLHNNELCYANLFNKNSLIVSAYNFALSVVKLYKNKKST